MILGCDSIFGKHTSHQQSSENVSKGQLATEIKLGYKIVGKFDDQITSSGVC